jgi:inosine-uridine nucleoside N-ribohydrolase
MLAIMPRSAIFEEMGRRWSRSRPDAIVARPNQGGSAMATPIILDCDTGTDDAIAILLALASPELDVRAITVAGGNVGLDRTLANTLALARLARSDVPVYQGADRPLLGSFVNEPRVHGIDGMGGIVLPEGGTPAPELAADGIRRILRTSPEPVTLVGIAPVTNLALALMTEPALTANVAEIVLMSGAWAEGNATPAAEFNALNDPEALAVLLACGRKVVFATLELTAQALVTSSRLAVLRGLGQGQCLAAACDIQASVPPSRRLPGAPLHDPCAIAWLLRPELFTTRDCSVRVDLGPGIGRGRTVIDRWDRTGDAHNAVVLETLDAEGFFSLLGERLVRLV